MWYTINFATQGLRHEKDNIPCQDSTHALIIDGRFHAVALADGAGSSSISQYGAEIVTKTICTDLHEHFSEYYSIDNGIDVKTRIISVLRTALQDFAISSEFELQDLASTLLAVAIKDDMYILVHLGDGIIAIEKDDGTEKISLPQNGEFINTTYFVTSPGAEFAMIIAKGRTDSVMNFILMSDGTSASLFDKKNKKLSETFRSKINNKDLHINILKDIIELGLKTVIRESTEDDCSIAILYKKENSQIFSAKKDDIQIDEWKD